MNGPYRVKGVTKSCLAVVIMALAACGDYEARRAARYEAALKECQRLGQRPVVYFFDNRPLVSGCAPTVLHCDAGGGP